MKKLVAFAAASLFVLTVFAQGALAQTSGGTGSTGSSGSSSQTPAAGGGSSAGGTSSGRTSGTGSTTGKDTATGGSMSKESSKASADQESVRQAQEQLKSAGFDPGPIDGMIGPQTQKALREYQKSKGMKETGQLDQETRQALLAGGAAGTPATTPSTPGGTPSTPEKKSDSGTPSPGGTTPGAGGSPGTGKSQ